jgi:hypothetical protein
MCRLLIYKGTSPVQLSHVRVLLEYIDLLNITTASHETRPLDHKPGIRLPSKGRSAQAY